MLAAPHDMRQPEVSPDTAKCPLGNKTIPTENHCFKVSLDSEHDRGAHVGHLSALPTTRMKSGENLGVLGTWLRSESSV